MPIWKAILKRDSSHEMKSLESFGVPGKDSEREQDMFDEPELKPEWLSAEEMFAKGQSVRDELTEKMLNDVFKQIHEVTELGRTRVSIYINILKYQGVISGVIKTLDDMGYRAQTSREKQTQYSMNEAVNSLVILKIAWEKR